MGIFMDQFRQAEISPINKRSIEIDGHRTSVSLEDAFWVELKKIAAIHNVRTAELIATINRERKHPNLSSAIRVFVLHHYREQTNDDLHHATYGATRRASWSSLTAAER
jgi:predicted DNA-binding ribbon-helix-helix protein